MRSSYVSWSGSDQKGYLVKYVNQEKPDVICFQETKTQSSTAIAQMLGSDYPYEYWNHSVTKLGYAGTAYIWRPPAVRLVSKTLT